MDHAPIIFARLEPFPKILLACSGLRLVVRYCFISLAECLQADAIALWALLLFIEPRIWLPKERTFFSFSRSNRPLAFDPLRSNDLGHSFVMSHLLTTRTDASYMAFARLPTSERWAASRSNSEFTPLRRALIRYIQDDPNRILLFNSGNQDERNRLVSPVF